MRAEILTIGDELCRGEIVNTNASTLAALLWDADITARWLTSCTDDAADITTALRAATGRADLVLCSGGLGPTEDDLTVDVVSALLGVQPVVDEAARARMQAFFERASGGLRTGPAGGATSEARPPEARSPKPEALMAIQLRQVRVPAGARVHPNPVGLAPGFEVAIAGVPVLCLPGFPREIAGILSAGAIARIAALREARGDVEHIARRTYRVFGRGESQISQACRGLVDDVAGATIHYQVKFPETLVKIVVRDRDAAAATARLAAIDAPLRDRLGAHLYSDTDEQLPERVIRRATAAHRTIATAESCTGGMIGELLTRVPGSSRPFAGGAITYSNAEKVRQLGVAEATLAAHGAVSEETVREMAAGARDRFHTDLAVAVSGIAGPDGGTPDKPVGTVWLALATATETTTKKINFPGTRDQIRQLAAWWALSLLDAHL